MVQPVSSNPETKLSPIRRWTLKLKELPMIISDWKSSLDSNHKYCIIQRAPLQTLVLCELLTEPKGLQLFGSNLQPISSTLEPFGSNLEMISMDDGSVNQQKVKFEL